MNKLNDLKELLTKKKKLDNELTNVREKISNIVETLTVETFENLSYNEALSLYNDVYYYSSFEKIKNTVEAVIKTKREEAFPDTSKAFRYPILNSLDIELSVIKKIDDALYRMRVGQYLLPMSSLWRPFRNYLDLLVEVGICEAVYRLTSYDEDSGDEETTLITQSELDKYKRCWELNDKKDLTDEEVVEIDKLYEEGYFSICVGYDEITNSQNFEDFHKEKIYKLIMAPDNTYSNITI